MKSAPLLLVGACFTLLPALAGALEPEWDLKLRLVGLGDAERDLGLRDAPERNEAYLDFTPSLHWPLGAESSAYLRLRAFLPSGEVIEEEDERAVRSKSYLALRELWFEYGGLTSYPGEVLRLGLQRLRAPDGLWWDQDVESVHWIFDTTLLRAHFGIAEEFATYRTDDVEVPESQQDRTYAYASWAVQWLPGHHVGIRGTYAQDRGDLPALGSQTDEDDRSQDRQVGWAALHIENGFFDYRKPGRFAYRAEVIGYAGTHKLLLTDNDGTVSGKTTQDVRALAGEVAARYRLPAWPLHLGAAYAYGQGGRSDGTSRNFQQTGLHSNRSRFTGTRTQMNRFNEALRADLTNLHVATGFASVQLERYDFSLVYNRFRRDDRLSPISTDGIDIDPLVNSADIGDGIDLVLTRHFDRVASTYGWDDDLHSNLRLRASQFNPGEAYGSGAKDRYRLTVETTLWF